MNTEQNKIAIVTGGGSGLGLAIAKKFVENNITTAIVGRDEQKLSAAKESLGGLCHTFQCDLTHLPAIPKLVQDIIERFGKIDVLVNNAGINQKKEFTEVTDEEFLHVINTNVCAVFAISREVVKHMKAAGGGCIINVSSMAAQYGIPKVIAYSAGKTAVEGMTRAMAVELAPSASAPTPLHRALFTATCRQRPWTATPNEKPKCFRGRRWAKWATPKTSAKRCIT